MTCLIRRARKEYEQKFFICNSLPQRRSLGYQVTPGKQARVVSFNYYAKPADPGIEWKNRNFYTKCIDPSIISNSF